MEHVFLLETFPTSNIAKTNFDALNLRKILNVSELLNSVVVLTIKTLRYLSLLYSSCIALS